MKPLQQITLVLLTTSACCISNEITFEPIENYLNKPQQTSSSIYQSCEALNRYANNLFSMKKYEEAIAIYQKAIALNSTHAELFFNLGQTFYAIKKYPEALEAYKKTVRLNNNHHQAYAQLGQLMANVYQPDNVIILLKKSLSLQPNNPEARLLLAQTYKNKSHFNEAIQVLIEGLALEPHHVNLTFELGQIYSLINKLDESLALYQELDQRIPNKQSILYNIAYTLKQMGKLDEAILFYNRVLENEQHHNAALFGRGLAYLAIGDFEKGLAGYECRYQPPFPPLFQLYDKPEWDGSDLSGKTILIHNAEQSFGDTLQFIRYAKLIKEKNGIVIAAVQTALVPLIKLCPYIDNVVSKDEAPPYFDVHARIMSLPYILQTRLDTIPHEQSYLTADEQLVAHWKEQLAANKNFKIGICWQGNNDPTITPLLRATIAQKSVHPQEFAPLCAVPGVSIYSLQKNTGTDQLNELPNEVKIITFDGDFDQSNGRFMDTAAVIKNLDLVITVDTSIGHLAAGLGVPTWVILPKPADWRWMIKRTDTPWYPTMRLFRQPTPGNWEALIQEVTQELKKYIVKK